MKKKIVSAFVLFVMVFNIFIPASMAITQSEFDKKLSSLKSTYSHGSQWTQSFDGGIQCYGYANMISYNVFGTSAKYWSKSYSLSGVKAGDVIQYGNTTGSGHTIFVTNVSGDTITYTDCNSDWNCTVKWGNTVSISSNKLWSYSFSYRCVAPDLEPDEEQPVDLGTDFYAVIFHKSSWKPITYDDDKYIRLRSENGSANQVWKFNRESDGCYTIASAVDGSLLELTTGSLENKLAITALNKDWGGAYQRWYLYGDAGGCTIMSKHFPNSKRALDVAYGSSEDGTPIEAYDRLDNDNQTFYIYMSDSVKLTSPELSVKTTNTTTTFSWNNVYGAKEYDLKIWKGTYWDGDPYYSNWDTRSPNVVELPPGHYEGYVDVSNAFDVKMSNIVIFDIKQASITPQVDTSGSVYKVNVSISDLLQNAICTAAVYDADGTLLEIDNVSLNSGTVSTMLAMAKHSDGAYIKIFLWNSLDGMKPLCESKEIPL